MMGDIAFVLDLWHKDCNRMTQWMATEGFPQATHRRRHATSIRVDEADVQDLIPSLFSAKSRWELMPSCPK